MWNVYAPKMQWLLKDGGRTKTLFIDVGDTAIHEKANKNVANVGWDKDYGKTD